MCELPPEGVGLNEVDEGLLPVDLDDGDQLPVARLQLRIASDVDLVELEPELALEPEHGLARPLAQVAVDRVVQAN